MNLAAASVLVALVLAATVDTKGVSERTDDDDVEGIPGELIRWLSGAAQAKGARRVSTETKMQRLMRLLTDQKKQANDLYKEHKGGLTNFASEIGGRTDTRTSGPGLAELVNLLIEQKGEYDSLLFRQYMKILHLAVTGEYSNRASDDDVNNSESSEIREDQEETVDENGSSQEPVVFHLREKTTPDSRSRENGHGPGDGHDHAGGKPQGRGSLRIQGAPVAVVPDPGFSNGGSGGEVANSDSQDSDDGDSDDKDEKLLKLLALLRKLKAE